MLFNNIKAVFLSNIIIQIIGIAASFVIKRFIGPSMMGIWNLVSIIIEYIQRFNLGTPTAAQREIPYYLGQGNLDMERKVRETFFSVIILEVFIASMVFLLFFFIKGNFLAVSFWFLYLLAPFYALANRIYVAMLVCFQSRQQFVELSKQNVMISIAGIIFTVIGGWLGGIIGLFIGFALLYLFRIYLGLALARKTGFSFTVKFHPAVFRELFKLGAPMEIASYLWGVFISIDSVLAAKWLGVESLAFYALGVNLSRQLSDFPTQVNTIFYPRIMQKYGKENDVKSLSNDFMAFFVGNFLVVIPFLCLAAALFLPWLIRTLIPNYSPAIPSARLLLFSMFFVPQMHILMSVFNMKKQVGRLIIFNASALFITFTSIIVLNYRVANLWTIAVGTLVGYGIFFILLFVFSTREVLRYAERIRIIMFQAGALIFTITTLYLLEKAFPASYLSWKMDLAYTMLKVIIAFLLCLPIAIYGLKLSRAWEQVRREMSATWNGLRFKIKSFVPEISSEEDGQDN